MNLELLRTVHSYTFLIILISYKIMGILLYYYGLYSNPWPLPLCLTTIPLSLPVVARGSSNSNLLAAGVPNVQYYTSVCVKTHYKTSFSPIAGKVKILMSFSMKKKVLKVVVRSLHVQIYSVKNTVTYFIFYVDKKVTRFQQRHKSIKKIPQDLHQHVYSDLHLKNNKSKQEKFLIWSNWSCKKNNERKKPSCCTNLCAFRCLIRGFIIFAYLIMAYYKTSTHVGVRLQMYGFFISYFNMKLRPE